MVRCVCLLILFSLVAACQRATVVPDKKPTFLLLLPSGNGQWTREIADGFEKAGAQFQFNTGIVRLDSYTPEHVLELVKKSPNAHGAPICVVFKRKDAIEPVVRKLRDAGEHVICLGADNYQTKREAMVEFSAENLAFLWRVRMEQFSPKPTKALFVFGDEPLKPDRITASIFDRSEVWTRFRPKFVEMTDVTAEQIADADIVTPFGRAALEKCRELGAKVLLPVCSDDTTIGEVESGALSFAIAPRYFEMGARSFRVAREYYLKQSIQNPSVGIKYSEIDSTAIRIYQNKRYDLPQLSATGRPKK